jgi:ornithine carbamoyltransferase
MAAVATIQVPRTVEALKAQDFLSLADWQPDVIFGLLELAAELKRLKRSGTPHRWLEGQSFALYFEKPSNRTRVSFEVGAFDLGMHPIMLRKEEINLGVRETIADTARTLSRYVDGIMIRTFAHQDVMDLAQHATVPVINGLTDDHHPCQVMADLLTIQEHFQWQPADFKGKKLVYVGDGNNMAHSLLEGGALVGMDVTIACPNGYQPAPAILARCQQIATQTGATLAVEADVTKAATGADVLYTDVWASMGQEAEAEARKQVFKSYQINDALLAVAKPTAIVLHCLPAHRGEEITADVVERFAPVIFEEAENRLHAQKAVMVGLMSA